MAERLVVEFDHNSRSFLRSRLAGWQRLRRTPVAFSQRHGGYWVVSGYDEVARVSRDEATFTSVYGDHDGVRGMGIAGVPRPKGVPKAGIAEADAALHQDLRRALSPFLLPSAVEAMRPLVEDLTHWFIDQKIETGQMDLVHDLATPVPAVLTLLMLGLPGEQWVDYADLFHGTMAHRPSSAEYQAAVARIPAMMRSLMAEVQARRAQPGADMLSALVALTGPGGAPLGDEEVGAILWNLVGGGLDTTTSLASLSLHHLATHPAVRRRLLDDRELLAPATEEFLRYFSVNETLSRTVTGSTELGGQAMCPGEVVLLSWLSANHDESVFDRPDEVVVDRAPNRHLAFGIGAHRCIGMHLARTTFQVMVGAVLDRLPDYQAQPPGPVFYEDNPIMAGMVSLPVSFAPGPRLTDGRRPF
jgi:cytochrome P450